LKWYLTIECSNTVKKPLVCDSSNFEEYGYDELDFKKGVCIVNWNDDLFLQAKKKRNNGIPDDVLQNYMMLPIYSPLLIEELNKANIGGIQYLPVRILKLDNDSLNGFYIANILNFIDAFDEKKSDFNRFSDDFPNPNARGKIAGVKKYVLKKEKLIGFDIIRLKEYKLSFFINEKFKDIFEQNKFTGYSFQEVELI
jgi:hypothetical protein